MFKRKVTSEFYAWKNSTGKKKALVVKGLRQIGKTYSVRAFAQENYENVVYINFKDNSSIKAVFDGDVVLVEVKASNGNTKSANVILKNKEKYNVNMCIKMSESNIGFDGNKLSIPSYMGFLLF